MDSSSLKKITLPVFIVTMIILVLIVLVVLVVSVLRRKPHKNNNVSSQMISIADDKGELDGQALYAKVMGNAIYNAYMRAEGNNMQKLINTIKQKVKELDIDLDEIELPADMPLVDLKNNYPKIYDVLAESGFLGMVGNHLAFPLWSLNHVADIMTGKLTLQEIQNSMGQMSDCVTKLGNFSDVVIWQNMGNPSGPLGQCVQK